MNLDEVARITARLPERYADRVSANTAKILPLIAAGGETGELLDFLLSDLRASGALISTAERDELAALLTACGMPANQLDGIQVTS
ncbi:MAG: hypothetical protein GEV11_23250 [Streptosporangiales bacterium]|nr:hypothetical protein [Streptosporangiales bacterium]